MTDETWPKKVRTTMRPDREIEVGPEEYLDLSRQDLLHVEPEPTKKAPTAPTAQKGN